MKSIDVERESKYIIHLIQSQSFKKRKVFQIKIMEFETNFFKGFFPIFLLIVTALGC